MLNSILWQTAILLLLTAAGLHSAAWFFGGMMFMLWTFVFFIAGAKRA